MLKNLRRGACIPLCGTLCLCAMLAAVGAADVEGYVRLDRTGAPLHGISVLIVQLGLTVETDAEGYYLFRDVPAGTYDFLAHSGALSSDPLLVEVKSAGTQTLDFVLKLSPLRQEITVTASGQEETAFEAVQSVTSVDSYTLAQKMAVSLGEVLDGEPGVSKRSFGPGSARPVIRGFDGDRVLVMQDGVRLGSLASQSGDHGEPVDPAGVERLEILKGPATLLYGSNAIGGVVNAVTGHSELHERPHQGITGQYTGVVGSTNGQAGSSARFELGHQKWLFWAGGGGQRSGDYDTPAGRVDNSKSRISNLGLGAGYFAEKAYLSLGYTLNDGRYGIPEVGALHGHDEDEGLAEEIDAIDVDMRRNNYRLNAGLRKLGAIIQDFDFSLTHTDWQHDEVEVFPGGVEEIGTEFRNRQWVYRGVFEQSPKGRLAGRFGFWGLARDYDVRGEEALSPPVDQSALALFALEELSFERARLQFGARLELNDYRVRGLQIRSHDSMETPPGGSAEPVALPDRDFAAVSAGVGGRFDVGKHGAFIANFTSSYRAPALEELYNFGPHVGNLAFEIGNALLEGERSNGLDLSFRLHRQKIHANASFFYYDINDFIFLQPTGEIREGLLEGNYSQADSRFTGAEIRFDRQFHPKLWLNLGLDVVDAQLTDRDQALPRIPPVKGRIGLDFRFEDLSIRPEVVVAGNRRGAQIAPGETPTAGYTELNLKAAYTIATQHLLHQLSLEIFNAGDRLLRNHVSFIKDLAPEIGRGIRFVYTVKFF